MPLIYEWLASNFKCMIMMKLTHSCTQAHTFSYIHKHTWTLTHVHAHTHASTWMHAHKHKYIHIPYSGKVWRGESLANLVNHPRFVKLTPSKLVFTINNLLADLLIYQTFFRQIFETSQFTKLFSHQTFLLYGTHTNNTYTCTLMQTHMHTQTHAHACKHTHVYIHTNTHRKMYIQMHANTQTNTH